MFLPAPQNGAAVHNANRPGIPAPEPICIILICGRNNLADSPDRYWLGKDV